MADTTAKLHPNDVQFRQTRAAAEHIDEIVTAAAVVAPSTGRYPTMRGMKRLANLAPTILESLDTKADAVADKLMAEKVRAENAIDQYDGLATSLGQVADEVTAALGQITNDPTQVSGA